MRIIAGKYKRRNVIWPEDSTNIRPTKDRIREALFSALGDLEGKNVLDLYAGSGAMGIEALSRNAKFCTFVDQNKIAIKTIKTNLENLKITQAKVLFTSDDLAIKGFIANKNQFDLVIMDPPYEKGRYEEIIQTFIDNELFSKNAILVTESNRDINIDDTYFPRKRVYHYGEIIVTIFWRN